MYGTSSSQDLIMFLYPEPKVTRSKDNFPFGSSSKELASDTS